MDLQLVYMIVLNIVPSLYETDKNFDRIPLYNQDTVMYIRPITREIFKNATPISCDNTPQNVIALDLDTNEHYVLPPERVLRATPMLFEPKQVQSAIIRNTFTAQAAGIHSNAELTNFCKHVFYENL